MNLHARPTAIVVGGGPGGLMAAEVLARSGASVTVFDHMPSVGRKLLLAGRGGLNITHSEPIESFLARYGPGAARLEPSIRAFTPQALRNWCAELGEPTVIGTGRRVFPASLRATPLLRAWLVRLAAEGVRVELGQRWVGWGTTADGELDPHRLRFVAGLAPGGVDIVEIRSDVSVFALGGASWPRVGSDGGWVDAFRLAGVTVNELRPANCGLRVTWTDSFATRFAGVPLKNVAVSANGGTAVRGDAMITVDGIEGSPVYPLTPTVRNALDLDGSCVLLVDLHPDLSVEQVRQRLTRRRPKDSLATALRRSVGLDPVAIGLLREATGNAVPADAPALAALVKAVPLNIVATMPIARAISTAGGVALDELDESFMLRRLPGTFVVGEMLDWEAPTGGYLLQATFSTAVAAARGADGWLATRWRSDPQRR